MQLDVQNIAIAAGILIATLLVIRITIKYKNSGNKISDNSGNITIGDNNNHKK